MKKVASLDLKKQRQHIDSFNFELEDWNLLKEKQENTLYFNISKGYYEYCPSED